MALGMTLAPPVQQEDLVTMALEYFHKLSTLARYTLGRMSVPELGMRFLTGQNYFEAGSCQPVGSSVASRKVGQCVSVIRGVSKENLFAVLHRAGALGYGRGVKLECT